MRSTWLNLVGIVLRPRRPHLARCLREREEHLATRRRFAEERALAIARCEARIESARSAVFAANDGVVGSQMIDLEREWRSLSRSDSEAGLMDLWARVAPASWVDRKRWRDSEPCDRVDAAIALASDPDGVDETEGAIDALHLALAPWGVAIGSRIRWRPFDRDSECMPALLAEPLRAACDALKVVGAESIVLERAQRLEREVHAAGRSRFPERPLLARDLAHAAFVDSVWRAAPSLRERPNPMAPLYDIWSAGYRLSTIDPTGVTIELPPLPKEGAA